MQPLKEMPIASGLGFVDREYHVRTVVRSTTTNDESPSSEYVPKHAERVVCGSLITTVVAGALTTLVWFASTFEHS